ncbi:MAG: YqhA family protein [Pseudomonadota bacterium]
MQDPPIRSRLFAATRYLVVIGVAGSFVAASALMIYGGIEVVMLVVDAVREAKVSSKGAKALALAFIEVVDLFLLATVFYIIALGLYELFINPTLALPEWLVIRDLDDLKNKLTGVVIVVMAVLFLGQVVTWDGERDLLRFGAGIALVVAALSYFLSLKAEKTKPDHGE